MNKIRRRSSKKRRQKTFAEQNGLCYYCGRATTFDKWTIDHMDPLSRRGSRLAGNRIGSCYSCNKSKGNMTLDEFLQTNYLSDARRAELGYNEPALFHYKIAKKGHNSRLTMMVRFPIHVRIGDWLKKLWQKILKLS